MRAAVDVAARAIFTRRASARRLALTVVLWSVAAGNAAMHVVAAKLGGGAAHAAAEFIATLD